MATITESRWIEQYDLKEERGEHVRLDWPAGQPPTELTDQRAVAARLTAEFAWRPAFFAQFSCDKAQESLRTCAAVVCLFSFDSWCAENTRIVCRVLVLSDSRFALGKTPFEQSKNQ